MIEAVLPQPSAVADDHAEHLADRTAGEAVRGGLECGAAQRDCRVLVLASSLDVHGYHLILAPSPR